jgi:cell division protein FtsB
MPAAAAVRPRRAPIRWDRVGRIALLCVLCGILLLYVSPIMRWRTQSATAEAQRAEVQQLERENTELDARLQGLRNPSALEEEARRLGMVKRGEVPLVIQNLPAGE